MSLLKRFPKISGEELLMIFITIVVVVSLFTMNHIVSGFKRDIRIKEIQIDSLKQELRNVPATSNPLD